jgi:hypothetical protein
VPFVTATDAVTNTITGHQTVGVTPAAAASLTVSQYPSPTTAGTSHTFMVQAKDAYGNVATGYLGTITFTSSDSQAVLPANYTFVSSDHGSHTFSATFKTAGTQSVTATDTVTSTITGTQSGIVVNPAAASILVLSGFPSPIIHGTAGTFTVTAKDAYGNTVTGYRGTLRSSSSDTAAVIAGYTNYDTVNAAIETALMSILAEWQSSDSYATRFNDIDTGTGGGRNGSNKLNYGTTVFDNGKVNMLTAHPGTAIVDWFFGNCASGHTTINNFETGEHKNDT